MRHALELLRRFEAKRPDRQTELMHKNPRERSTSAGEKTQSPHAQEPPDQQFRRDKRHSLADWFHRARPPRESCRRPIAHQPSGSHDIHVSDRLVSHRRHPDSMSKRRGHQIPIVRKPEHNLMSNHQDKLQIIAAHDQSNPQWHHHRSRSLNCSCCLSIKDLVKVLNFMDQCVTKLRATGWDITPQVWLSSKDGLLTRLKHRCNPIPFRVDIRKWNPSGLSLPHKHIPRCKTMNRAYRHQATIHSSLNRWQDKDRELAHAVHTNPFHRVTNILIGKA